MHLYAIAIGSNRTRGIGRRPAALVHEAIVRLGALGRLAGIAPSIETAAVGPSDRRFVNGACLIETTLDPPRLLTHLKAIERAMGRRPGRRWGARTIDLDILLWSGGAWQGRRPRLLIPHAGLAGRSFVLIPLAAIAAGWRLPDGRYVRHLAARLTGRTAFHRSRFRSGP